LLLGTDNKERTAWHVSTQCGKLEVLQNALRRAEKSLTIDVINNKLLGTDNKETTFRHVTAEEFYLVSFE